MIRNFSDLEVYKKAFEASIDVHLITEQFPKHEQFSLTVQIRRASKSICANLAEGFVKQQASKPEFKRYILMSMGSATEMLVWIQYAERLKYIDQDKAQSWQDSYNEVIRMLQGLYNKVEL